MSLGSKENGWRHLGQKPVGAPGLAVAAAADGLAALGAEALVLGHRRGSSGAPWRRRSREPAHRRDAAAEPGRRAAAASPRCAGSRWIRPRGLAWSPRRPTPGCSRRPIAWTSRADAGRAPALPTPGDRPSGSGARRRGVRRRRSLVGRGAADVAVAGLDRAAAPGLLAGAALRDRRADRAVPGWAPRPRRGALRPDGGGAGLEPCGHAADVAVAVDDRAGAARLRAVHGRGLCVGVRSGAGGARVQRRAGPGHGGRRTPGTRQRALGRARSGSGCAASVSSSRPRRSATSAAASAPAWRPRPWRRTAPARPTDLVALGQPGGIRLVGEVEGARDPLEPAAVCRRARPPPAAPVPARATLGIARCGAGVIGLEAGRARGRGWRRPGRRAPRPAAACAPGCGRPRRARPRRR